VTSAPGEVALPIRIVKLRRPRADWLHLECRSGDQKFHLGARLEAPLAGLYLLEKPPLSGARPHGSQGALKHRCEGRTAVALGLAPGLLELHLDDGNVLAICWRRKGFGVRWLTEARLSVDEGVGLGSLARVCPEQLEARRVEQHTERLRAARRKSLERAIERQERAFEKVDPEVLSALAQRAASQRHRLVVAGAAVSVPAYDPAEKPDNVALKKGEKTVSDVIDRLFHQARRARRRRVQASARIEQIRAQLAGLAEAPMATEATEAIRAEPNKPSLGPGIRGFSLVSGRALLVGSSALANHRLTFAIARGSDLWFHARDVAGPHVILRCAKGESVPVHERLLAAAAALRMGGLRDRGAQDVRCTPRRYLDPVRGAPGRVLVRRETVLRVDPETASLRAALDALF
jgi:hypothetical protein